MAQMPGAPEGQFRDDQYVPAAQAAPQQPAAADPGSAQTVNRSAATASASSGVMAGAACSAAGSMGCSNGGSGFMLCNNGAWTDMGSVAAGTKCENGAIVAA